MQKLIVSCVLAITLVLAGCSAEDIMKRMTPQVEEKIARQFIENIRTRNFAPVEQKLDPKIAAGDIRQTFERMAAIFPPGAPKSVKVVGSNTGSFAGGVTSYNITFEYEFANAWVIANAAFVRENGAVRITDMNVYPMKASLESINAFTLQGKSPLALVFFAVTIGVALFTIGTAIVCARTPIPKRKWLWVLFALLGVGALQMNWVTGELVYGIVTVNLFGAAYTQNFYGPPLLSFGIPLGAIVFWFKRRGWLNEQVAVDMRP